MTYVFNLPMGPRSRAFVQQRLRRRLGLPSEGSVWTRIRSMRPEFREHYRRAWTLECVREAVLKTSHGS